MRCVFCDKEIEKYSFSTLFLKQDLLCVDCRNKMPIKRKIIDYGKIKVEAFYDYNSLFKDILIQYKEAYDEILKDVFMYWLDDYINYRYWNYDILLMPSSEKKLKERGFNHLELIFKNLKQNRVTGLSYKNQLIQEGLNRKQRLKMKDNFIYLGDYHDRVLVLDDVVTTSSSLLGVYEVLRKKVKHIKLLSLAYKNCTNQN